ncbi:MAG: T9SS type A sorting domain-containing protein [Sphingobacteriales bacterium]|nr:MAG: T9SS type A sorting domain-containing protein [Sphingobacteriales bacterium]
MRILSFCVMLASTSLPAAGQQATASGAGSGGNNNFKLDWSVGELTLVNTARNGAFVLTQGLLQGKLLKRYDSGGITAGELVIYPNPTPDMLTVQTGFFGGGELNLRLYDVQGRQLQLPLEAVSTYGTQTISMKKFASGTYMLHASFRSASGEIRTGIYRIVRRP